MYFLLSLLFSATALAGVQGTSHDFSTSGPLGTQGPTDQICIYCHTPHNAAPVGDIGAPLWNHDYDLTTSYVMYDNSISVTMDMTVAAKPEGVSLACLSCHDGVMAVSDYINGPNPDDQSVPMPGTGLLGTDLSNDHPISVGYDPTLDVDFQPNATVVAAGLPLFNGGTTPEQVECGTCHNVHDNSLGNFMRLNNAQSALCLTCHIK
jgi:predicted CXXCH cytochrome family protein